VNVDLQVDSTLGIPDTTGTYIP